MTAILDDVAGAREPETATPEPDMVGICDGCGRRRPIVAGILLMETGDQETEDLGFEAELVRVPDRRPAPESALAIPARLLL